MNTAKELIPFLQALKKRDRDFSKCKVVYIEYDKVSNLCVIILVDNNPKGLACYIFTKDNENNVCPPHYYSSAPVSSTTFVNTENSVNLTDVFKLLDSLEVD